MLIVQAVNDAELVFGGRQTKHQIFPKFSYIICLGII